MESMGSFVVQNREYTENTGVNRRSDGIFLKNKNEKGLRFL